MPIGQDVSVDVGHVVWVTSLKSEDIGSSQRAAEDTQTACEEQGIHFQLLEISELAEFDYLLNQIYSSTLDGANPILHLDMHGSKNSGLQLSGSGEYASWEWLSKKLRRINEASESNLCVVGAACHGLSLAWQLNVSMCAPFFLLIAPPEKVCLSSPNIASKRRQVL